MREQFQSKHPRKTVQATEIEACQQRTLAMVVAGNVLLQWRLVYLTIL
jgi:hypothetical protein